MTSGGNVVRFGFRFGDDEGAGSRLVGEGECIGFVGCGDSTVAILSSDICCA